MSVRILVHHAENAHFLLFRRMAKMRVTIDLERDIIIIPDNFFKKIAEENEKLERYGAKPVKPLTVSSVPMKQLWQIPIIVC